ncbi:hypothetical protein ABTF55_20210, partial [Acinetobacter baumannii]
MDIYKTYLRILDRPWDLAGYRELRKYYLDRHLQQEADALTFLIEEKTRTKNAPINDTSPD